MYKKKKGMSLLECTVSMAIAIIIFTTSVSSVNMFSKMTFTVTSRYLDVEINNFFQFAKEYCSINNIFGIIKIYNNGNKNNKFLFVVKNKIIRVLNLPEYITFKKELIKYQEYAVNNYGIFEKCETIKLRYKDSKDINVVIRVVTNKT